MNARTIEWAAAVSAVVLAGGALAQANLKVTAIDNTWRVPAGDPTYDPAQWRTLEVELFAQAAYTMNAVEAVWTLSQGSFFHLASAGLLRPTPEQIAETPALRYSTFVDMSLMPLPSLMSVGSIGVSAMDAVCFLPSSQPMTLAPGQRQRVARITVSSNAATITGLSVLIWRPSSSWPDTLSYFPLTPFGSIIISETGDQYDNDMTLRVTLTGNNEFVQTGAFLPASRVTAVLGEYPGWIVRKGYVNGVHGVSITPLDRLDPTETLDICFLTNTPHRDLRYAHQPFRWDFGWWAPLAAPPIPGDVDDDGSVGFSDLNFVLAHWGEIQQTPYRLQADLSGNGIVDFDDLNIVLSFFGTVEAG